MSTDDAGNRHLTPHDAAACLIAWCESRDGGIRIEATGDLVASANLRD